MHRKMTLVVDHIKLGKLAEGLMANACDLQKALCSQCSAAVTWPPVRSQVATGRVLQELVGKQTYGTRVAVTCWRVHDGRMVARHQECENEMESLS